MYKIRLKMKEGKYLPKRRYYTRGYLPIARYPDTAHYPTWSFNPKHAETYPTLRAAVAEVESRYECRRKYLPFLEEDKQDPEIDAIEIVWVEEDAA